jgi:hypothetical protein
MKRKAIIIVLFAALVSAANTLRAQVPYGLSSNPGAPATIYLDFDGHRVNSPYWNGGIPFICAPTALTNAQMTRVFNQVSEDFRPFNLNITTDSAVYFATAINRRQRIIITPTSSWYGSAGGVAYVESFRWGMEIPGFVFSTLLNNNAKMVSEATSHETGHTLGLYHQTQYNSSCGFVDEYNPGTGSGEISWAPIMGNSYSRNITLWHNGPNSFGCGSIQNDLDILSSAANGFGYRTDDIANTSSAATPITITNNNYAISGFINGTSDIDFYSLNLPKSGRLVVDALPFNVGTANSAANIDLQVSLMSGNKVIGSYNPSSSLQAIIDTTLNSGTYYLRVNNTSNVNTSNYGMLGNYSITGSFTASGSLPIYSLNLSGSVDQGQHRLNWNIVADEAIESIRLEVSADGRNFTKLEDLTGTTRQFAYKPMDSKPLYYRLFVTTASQLTYYSNIVSLKETATSANYTLLSNRINGSDIVVNSKGSYSWRLLDMNGRNLQNGRLTTGVNRLQTPTLNSGMYLLQVIDGTNITTERLIKN